MLLLNPELYSLQKREKISNFPRAQVASLLMNSQDAVGENTASYFFHFYYNNN